MKLIPVRNPVHVKNLSPLSPGGEGGQGEGDFLDGDWPYDRADIGGF